MPPQESAPLDDLTGLFAVRLAAVALLVAGVVWLTLSPAKARTILRGYFLARSGPLNLAIFRIVVFAGLFRQARRSDVDVLLAVPPVLRNVAPGWGWLDQGLALFDPTLAHAAALTTTIAAGLTVVGLGTRIAAPIAALGAVYLFGLQQFFTKVNHAGHAAMWAALVLSASACGDALSFDSLLRTWRRGRARLSMPAEPRVAYAFPLRICWLLFGIGYFFAGLAKLWDAGDQWLTSQAIVARLSLVEATSFPLHEYPLLLVLGGAGTLFFELGFVFLLFSKWTRLAAIAMGLMFHLGVKVAMGINFTSMLRLYVGFIDFEWVLGRWAHHLPRTLCEHLALPHGAVAADSSALTSATERLPRFVVAVGAVLVMGNCYAGYARISSWPFTVFPRFSTRVKDDKPQSCSNRMVIVKPSGKVRVIQSSRLRPPIRGPRWNYLVADILETKDKAKRRELFEASATLIQAAKIPLRAQDQLAIERVCVSEVDGRVEESRKIRATHRR